MKTNYYVEILGKGEERYFKYRVKKRLWLRTVFYNAHEKYYYFIPNEFNLFCNDYVLSNVPSDIQVEGWNQS